MNRKLKKTAHNAEKDLHQVAFVVAAEAYHACDILIKKDEFKKSGKKYIERTVESVYGPDRTECDELDANPLSLDETTIKLIIKRAVKYFNDWYKDEYDNSEKS